MKRGRKRSEQSECRERTGVVKVVKGVGRSYKAKSGSDRENKNAGGTNKAAGRDVKRWLKWNRRESGNAARGSGRRRRATKEREARVPESGRRTDAGDPNNDEQGVESLSRGGSDRRARGIGEAGLGIPDGREVARLAGDWRESMERQVEEGGSRYVATQGRQVGKGPESLEGGWVMDLSRRARKTESGQRTNKRAGGDSARLRIIGDPARCGTSNSSSSTRTSDSNQSPDQVLESGQLSLHRIDVGTLLNDAIFLSVNNALHILFPILQRFYLLATTINTPNVPRMENAGLQHRVEGLVGLHHKLNTSIEEFACIWVCLDARQLAPRHPSSDLEKVPET
ncbi:hypothetical protein BJ322DRAFT_1018484 [Thelephora terrestris]|uniref:Uncharacterized protein n=1 Tax=Thelephora terrestris TaxID=56493 RepID=A0A9P6HM40_9AGAM|nr:hypothetical protein BJ322DRAFT_1018484 [Thelephora terrestris]